MAFVFARESRGGLGVFWPVNRAPLVVQAAKGPRLGTPAEQSEHVQCNNQTTTGARLRVHALLLHANLLAIVSPIQSGPPLVLLFVPSPKHCVRDPNHGIFSFRRVVCAQSQTLRERP